MQGDGNEGSALSRAVPFQISEFSSPICLGETHSYFNQCDLFCSFHAIVEVQFGELSHLDTAVNNYKNNLSLLPCRHDTHHRLGTPECCCVWVHALHLLLGIEWGLRGHHAILMHSTLTFACTWGTTGTVKYTMSRSIKRHRFICQCPHLQLM